MAEYIEREALIKRLEVTPLFNPQYEYDELVRKGIIDLVKQRPAVDVVEVRHGEWVKDTRTADVCAEYRCSLCGFMYCEADPKCPPYKYCPECGTKNE